MLTQSRLKEVLHYDPETGVFVWKVTRNNRVRMGNIAGVKHHSGYMQITVDKKLYRSHRLAFLYMYGSFPIEQIDHKDGDRANNKIDNLRECTDAQNKQNTATKPGSSSKFLGVSWNKNKNKWEANIHSNGKKNFLGYYTIEEEAYAAYCKAKSEMHQFNPVPR